HRDRSYLKPNPSALVMGNPIALRVDCEHIAGFDSITAGSKRRCVERARKRRRQPCREREAKPASRGDRNSSRAADIERSSPVPVAVCAMVIYRAALAAGIADTRPAGSVARNYSERPNRVARGERRASKEKLDFLFAANLGIEFVDRGPS